MEASDPSQPRLPLLLPNTKTSRFPRLPESPHVPRLTSKLKIGQNNAKVEQSEDISHMQFESLECNCYEFWVIKDIK
jgi:hypothetical protein